MHTDVMLGILSSDRVVIVCMSIIIRQLTWVLSFEIFCYKLS